MKRKYISIILLSTTFLFSNYALAAREATITIKGKVIEPACNLAIEGGNISFGNHMSTNLQIRTYPVSYNKGSFTGKPDNDFTKRATLNITDCYVRDRSVFVTFSGLRDSVHSNLGTSYARPFISDQDAEGMSDAGVYLITESKSSDGKKSVRDLNISDSHQHQVLVDLSDGKGSMTADFELVTVSGNSAKTGDINISVVANLIVP